MIFDSGAKRPLFATNPANTLTFSALRSLERDCVLHISEMIQRRLPDMTGETPLRRTNDILAHRTAIGHPARISWRKDWMQKFHDAGREHLDLRSAIIWDLQRSLNELAAGERYGEQNTDIAVTEEMAALLHQILYRSLGSQGRETLPSAHALGVELVQFAPKYIALLERYPSGRSKEAESSDTGG